jgi:hypothetical protein
MGDRGAGWIAAVGGLGLEPLAVFLLPALRNNGIFPATERKLAVWVTAMDLVRRL